MQETIPEIRLKIYLPDAKLASEQLYKFLRGFPLEIRKSLQARIDDFPLTKEANKRYVPLEDYD